MPVYKFSSDPKFIAYEELRANAIALLKLYNKIIDDLEGQENNHILKLNDLICSMEVILFNLEDQEREKYNEK